MRKVVVYELLSLDGVAEQPDNFITEFDEVMRDNLGRVIATQDSVLLGAELTTIGPLLASADTSRSPASSTASRSSWRRRRHPTETGSIPRSSMVGFPSFSPI